jgi:hypothetical protein
MSDRLEWFELTIPANTPASAPVSLPCVFRQGEVIEIDVKVPPGPSGNVGFFVGAGGSQYVPRTVGSFVMPDKDYFVWPISNAINSGSWSVTAYNTDIFPHNIQVAFHVNELGANAGVNGSLLGASSLQIPQSVTSPAPDNSESVDPLSPDFLIANIPPELDLTVSA